MVLHDLRVEISLIDIRRCLSNAIYPCCHRPTDARRPGTQYSRDHSPGDSGYYLLRSGIPARFQLALKPGNYVLHVAVRDNTNGHIGSLEMPLQVQK